MKQQKILVILFYIVCVFVYLSFSTKFKRGWTKKSIIVRGNRVSLLLFILIAVIVLMILVITPI